LLRPQVRRLGRASRSGKYALRVIAFGIGELSLCGVWSRSSPAHGAAHLRIEDDHKLGFCSTYGICGHRKDKDVLNCVNSTEAQPVASNVARKLQDVCPQLYKESGEQDGKYCCSEEQIDVLSKQVKNALICISVLLFKNTIICIPAWHYGIAMQ
jgi:hypothetical protein